MTSSTKQRKATKTWTRAKDSLQRHPVPDNILEAESSKLNTLNPTLYSTSTPTVPTEMELQQEEDWRYYTPRSPKYPQGSPQAEPEHEPEPELSRNEIEDPLTPLTKDTNRAGRPYVGRRPAGRHQCHNTGEGTPASQEDLFSSHAHYFHPAGTRKAGSYTRSKFKKKRSGPKPSKNLNSTYKLFLFLYSCGY